MDARIFVFFFAARNLINIKQAHCVPERQGFLKFREERARSFVVVRLENDDDFLFSEARPRGLYR